MQVNSLNSFSRSIYFCEDMFKMLISVYAEFLDFANPRGYAIEISLQPTLLTLRPALHASYPGMD